MKLNKFLFVIISFFICTASVNANTLSFCEQNGVLWVFKLIGYGLLILKILVPIIIVVLGVIDLSKAVISSKDEDIKKQSVILVKRIIAGVVIFLIPTIIEFAYKLVDENIDLTNSSSSKCITCMISPNDGQCDLSTFSR